MVIAVNMIKFINILASILATVILLLLIADSPIAGIMLLFFILLSSDKVTDLIKFIRLNIKSMRTK